ncbi:hypothetical protein EQG68_11550 [Flavobacterium piscinae]|uniref:DUF304 domain-containing protein n=2 Tax=Flavobacterium piscinae TaxID=2506424 RepID=A0A4Q1KL93_9FLAO|nr:hypothetical protein [Flavobacterium piscinae]RXR30683.1 hypothetical protein EQG68_11550 [Flavobacterium piscinae]
MTGKMEGYTWLIYLIYPTYLMIKGKKILLEIHIDVKKVMLKSYSIFGGRKELNLDINEIVELDFYRGFVIKYKTSLGKKTETFHLNAEPWNNLYGQIKNLKLAVQDMEQNKIENLNLKTSDIKSTANNL